MPPESKAHAEWVKNNTTQITTRFNHNTDADLLRWLSTQPSKQGAIKEALRYYLAALTREK